MAAYGMTLADGSEWTIQESAQPSGVEYASPFSLRDVFSGIKEVTSFALQTQQQLGAIQGEAEKNDFDRFMASLSLDTNRVIAQTQAETAKAQAQAALAKAQQNPVVASSAIKSSPANTLMMIAAVVGIVGVLYQLSRGK